jgi:hypothetical protein
MMLDLTKQEIMLLCAWFTAVRDVRPDYLSEEDAALLLKLRRVLTTGGEQTR